MAKDKQLALETFAREAAKGIKIEQDLNDFRQMLTKVTVERTLNAERDDPLVTINVTPLVTPIAAMAPQAKLFALKCSGTLILAT